MKYLKSAALMLVMILSAAAVQAQTDGDRIGEVKKIDKRTGEIIVGVSASAEAVKIGDLLYVRVDGKIVLLRASFPMQTVVKCRTEGANASLLTSVGAPVFRYTKNAEASSPEPAARSDRRDTVYKLGDKGPAGGFIFYDKGSYSDGWRYLEAASEDQAYMITWDNGSKTETGAAGTEIGTGKQNTKKIIAALGDGKYAAKLCADCRQGGKSDWFLPSKDELDMMYVNLKKTGIVDF